MSIKSRVQKIKESGVPSLSLPNYDEWVESRARDIDTPRQLIGAIGYGITAGASLLTMSPIGIGFTLISANRALYPSIGYQAVQQAQNEYALKYMDKISELELMAEELIPEDRKLIAKEKWGEDWYKYFAKELIEARYGTVGVFDVPVPKYEVPSYVRDWYGTPTPKVTAGQMSLGEYLDSGLPVDDLDLAKILDRW